MGITDLVPLYEDFEDGAELLWQELDVEDCDDNDLPLEILTEAKLEEFYGRVC